MNLAALAEAGGLATLLAHVEASVQKAKEDIDREITAARLQAAGGALQEHLFAPDGGDDRRQRDPPVLAGRAKRSEHDERRHPCRS